MKRQLRQRQVWSQSRGGELPKQPHCWWPAWAVPWTSDTEETKHWNVSLQINQQPECVTCKLCKHRRYRAEPSACHTSTVTSASSGQWQGKDDPALVDVSSTHQLRLLPFPAHSPNSKLGRKKGEENLVIFL